MGHGLSHYYPAERSKDEITDKNSGAYKEVERRAQALLDALFIELPDGSCKIKDEVNYSGARVFFKGDLYFHRKFTVHIPTQLANGEKFSAQEHMIDRLEITAKDYMVAAPTALWCRLSSPFRLARLPVYERTFCACSRREV